MTDFNPIPAEFGTDPTKIPQVPADKKTSEPNSIAFQEEMERKSRRVEEKDAQQQTKQEKEATHETIVLNPLIEEQKVTTNKYLESVFDVQKTSSKDSSSPVDNTSSQVLKADSPTKTQNPTEGEVQPPTQEDSFAKNLAAPIASVEKINQPVSKSAIPKTEQPSTVFSGEALIDSKKPIKREASSGSQNQSFGESQKNQKAPVSSLRGEKQVTPKGSFTPLQQQLEALIPKEIVQPKEKPLVTNQKIVSKEITPPEKPLLLSDVESDKKPETPMEPKTTLSSSFLETAKEELIEKTSQKPMEESPQELEEALTTGPLFAGPLPIESKRKEGVTPPEEEASEESVPVQAPSEASSLDQDKQDDDDLESANSLLTETAPQGQNAPPNVSIEGPTAPERVLSGFDRLPPHILDWFDRMVGIITVLQTQGKTETTVQLNSPKMPELAGTFIKITEYSTAPQAYNIEFTGSPEAVTMLQKQVAPLKNAFNTKNFNFTVNDITISLQNNQSTQEGNDL